MRETIMRRIDVTSTLAPLAAERLVGAVTITAAPTNLGPVFFRADAPGAADVPWVAGEWHTFVGVDLARMQVRGTPGDYVTVVGGTWD